MLEPDSVPPLQQASFPFQQIAHRSSHCTLMSVRNSSKPQVSPFQLVSNVKAFSKLNSRFGVSIHSLQRPNKYLLGWLLNALFLAQHNRIQICGKPEVLEHRSCHMSAKSNTKPNTYESVNPNCLSQPSGCPENAALQLRWREIIPRTTMHTNQGESHRHTPCILPVS